MSRPSGFLDLVRSALRAAAPVGRGGTAEAEAPAVVASYYAFRRELDRHAPQRTAGFDGATESAWHRDLQPGGRADAIVESHFGHPLSSPFVQLVRHPVHGRLLRIVLTWRGHRTPRVIWTEDEGVAEAA